MSGGKSLEQRAIEAGWENALDLNAKTGSKRISIPHNDVYWAIEELGGVAAAADRIGVEEIEIEHWIDDHYVPGRYAAILRDLTGFSVWSIQKPPFDQRASVGAVFAAV